MDRVVCGDCLDELPKIDDNSIDAIVTDPPAAINFMQKSWDSDKGGRTQWIAWMSRVAAECLRVIKPGGHALVWALPRTSHWTGMAWEEAGWEPRDKISHVFGSGFPKSLDISKKLDQMAGAEREVIGQDPERVGRLINQMEHSNPTGTWQAGKRCVDITSPATPAAKQWAGFGTALKPAHEDWWLFRKPLACKTIAENVLEWGCGGLNIDATRIEVTDRKQYEFNHAGRSRGDISRTKNLYSGYNYEKENPSQIGRFPANLIWSHSPLCKRIGTKKVKGNAHYSYKPTNDGVYKLGLGQLDDLGNPLAGADGLEEVESWDCHPSCPSWEFAKAGESKSIRSKRGGATNGNGKNIDYGEFNKLTGYECGYQDAGSPARFFQSCPVTEEDYYFTTCALCNKLIYQKHHVKNEVLSCNVNGAEKSSSQETEIADSVATHAQQKQQHESGVKSDKLNIPASSAVKSLSNMLETSGSFAQRSVNPNHIEKIAQNVRSAETLCGSCETAIVQSIVAMQQGRGQLSLPDLDYMEEPIQQILYQSLALFAETQEKNATIPTIPSLKMWFGYVSHAIENYTRLEKVGRMENISVAPTPFLYNSKASRAERERGLDGMAEAVSHSAYGEYKGTPEHGPNTNGHAKNFHPTVKPLSLMRYLCRLITPPGGLILDPFAGSGTTCLAAKQEGFRFLGIEKEAEYCDICRKRIAAIPASLDKWL